MFSNDMFTGIMLAFGAICIAVGAALVAIVVWVVPWLWALIKPWLHQITG